MTNIFVADIIGVASFIFTQLSTKSTQTNSVTLAKKTDFGKNGISRSFKVNRIRVCRKLLKQLMPTYNNVSVVCEEYENVATESS